MSGSIDLGAVPVALLAAKARDLVKSRSRVVLGIIGSPGAGKSSLAESLAAELGDLAQLVPMDGFHLAQAELTRLQLAGTKGSIATFDGAGYVQLLRRLRDQQEKVVYAPRFDRGLEEPIAGAIPVERGVPLVITEGNYLLCRQPPWDAVRTLLDETWFCSLPDDVRRERLVDRHVRFGKSREAALAWALGSDEANAVVVEETRDLADVIFTLADGRPVAADPAAASGRRSEEGPANNQPTL